MVSPLTTRLSQRLSALRAERDLTLEALAAQSGLSRAALSRMEKAEVSPTAEQLGKLCAAYGLPAGSTYSVVTAEMLELQDPRSALLSHT